MSDLFFTASASYELFSFKMLGLAVGLLGKQHSMLSLIALFLIFGLSDNFSIKLLDKILRTYMQNIWNLCSNNGGMLGGNTGYNRAKYLLVFEK